MSGVEFISNLFNKDRLHRLGHQGVPFLPTGQPLAVLSQSKEPELSILA